MSTSGGYGSNPPEDGRPDLTKPTSGADPAGSAPSYGTDPTPSYGTDPTPSYGAAGSAAPSYGSTDNAGQYGAQPATYPAGGGYPQPQGNNGMAIGSLVCGILSILGSCVWYASVPLGIAAIVLGVLARKKVRLGQAGQKGLATAGLVTGIIGLVLSVVIVIAAIVGISMFGDDIQACEGLTGTAQQECLQSALSVDG